MQRSLSNAEEEVKHQQEMCDRLHTELTAVAERSEQQSTEFEELSEKLRVMYLHYRKSRRPKQHFNVFVSS